MATQSLSSHLATDNWGWVAATHFEGVMSLKCQSPCERPLALIPPDCHQNYINHFYKEHAFKTQITSIKNNQEYVNKIENYVSFDRLSEDFKPRKQLLIIRTAEDFSKEVKEELGYTEFFATKTRQLEHREKKKLTLKKIRYLKLMNLALFHVQEDASVWTH